MARNIQVCARNTTASRTMPVLSPGGTTSQILKYSNTQFGGPSLQEGCWAAEAHTEKSSTAVRELENTAHGQRQSLGWRWLQHPPCSLQKAVPMWAPTSFLSDMLQGAREWPQDPPGQFWLDVGRILPRMWSDIGMGCPGHSWGAELPAQGYIRCRPSAAALLKPRCRWLPNKYLFPQDKQTFYSFT